MARKSKGKSSGVITARWTSSSLALLVSVTDRGVCSIFLDKDFVPGQTYLWAGVEPAYADLATADPWGAQLADELDQALSGRLAESKVPWVPTVQPWHRELYGYVCRLAPGRLTVLPDSLNLGGEYRQEREMISALRKCPVVPLVPLYRVAATEPIAFPWGEGWGSTLLQREWRHAVSLN